MGKTRRRPSQKSDQPFVKLTWRLVIDSNEQLPFSFANIASNADTGYKPYQVEIVRKRLATGDYSIEGHEDEVAIERKSLEDLFGSLSTGRKLEEAKHQRMAEMRFAAFVVEADWPTILNHPPAGSQLDPKIVYRTAISWQVKYGVHWWLCPGKRFAEITAFRFLNRFAEHNSIG